MSISATKKMANRYGLNIKLYTFADTADFTGNAAAEIDFANEVSLELASDTVWATGGQAHTNRIGFNNPYEGTLRISTQLVTMELLNIITNGTLSDTTAHFKSTTAGLTPKYYLIKGETVWQDEDGTTYTETIKCYKACVKPGYSVTYNGSGDPQSLDVEFQLGANSSGQVVDIEAADVASGS